ncbi:MAG TPA: MarR family transcriptional regulator [Solirubrobacteraceae bacterium]|nr:MarR family transcriptional regulator [Solirubrobacteraceae bacterium]
MGRELATQSNGDDPRECERARLARAVWIAMSELVLEHQRRREVSEAVGISFGRSRAVRRLARHPMSMRELADALEIDPPNATALVDELERPGLVRRRAHPTDRRARIVEATAKGKTLARRADAILATPPPALLDLDEQQLRALSEMLERAGAG